MPLDRLLQRTPLAVLLAGLAGLQIGCSGRETPAVDVNEVLSLAGDGSRAEEILEKMQADWHPGYAVMLLEIQGFAQNGEVRRGIARILQEQTGVTPKSFSDFYQAVWKAPYQPHPDYARFKAALYGAIDPQFEEYFAGDREATVRLDEIRWGGVARDGIPPLKDPEVLSADKATYLDDGDVVFGVEINGQARAYPKRILAWHEMVKDVVGGESINGVYCTLCGSMIVYRTEHGGIHHELGTSGFLYRSNKLMYDHRTRSMWNTLTGKPVLGPLAGKDIALERGTVVTTKWGEWRRRHPETTVLSLNTGHDRDYGEGVAYREYFETDELMFEVPDAVKDSSLENKAEVLALLADKKDSRPIAISADWLLKNSLATQQIGESDVVILTDHSGANRVYRTGGHQFVKWDGDETVVDSEGNHWIVTETALSSPSGIKLERYPSHRAFWFGWKAAYPDTILIH